MRNIQTKTPKCSFWTLESIRQWSFVCKQLHPQSWLRVFKLQQQFNKNYLGVLSRIWIPYRHKPESTPVENGARVDIHTWFTWFKYWQRRTRFLYVSTEFSRRSLSWLRITIMMMEMLQITGLEFQTIIREEKRDWGWREEKGKGEERGKQDKR